MQARVAENRARKFGCGVCGTPNWACLKLTNAEDCSSRPGIRTDGKLALPRDTPPQTSSSLKHFRLRCNSTHSQQLGLGRWGDAELHGWCALRLRTKAVTCNKLWNQVALIAQPPGQWPMHPQKKDKSRSRFCLRSRDSDLRFGCVPFLCSFLELSAAVGCKGLP